MASSLLNLFKFIKLDLNMGINMKNMELNTNIVNTFMITQMLNP